MRKITGEQHRKEQIEKLERKKNRTLFEAAQLLSLRNMAITPTLWDFERFKHERNKNNKICQYKQN